MHSQQQTSQQSQFFPRKSIQQSHYLHTSLQENHLLLFVEPAADTLAVVALVALVDSSPLVEVDTLQTPP
jgi:hypothetical protein